MELNIQLKYQNWQLDVKRNSTRYTVINAGRQLGKSWYAAAEAIITALSKPGDGWIISPSYRQSKIIFKNVVVLCRQFGIPVEVRTSQNQLTITFLTSGFVLSAVSSDDPDKLRGATLDLVIFDEAAMMKPDVWPEHIRPMTTVKKARCIFISTPKSKNWFYDIYKKGMSGKSPEWKSFTFTTYESEFISKEELEQIRAETDEITFRQEYLAEFLDNGGNVFPHFATQELTHTPIDGRVYIAGLDLARHNDFTVLTIADLETSEIVDMLRFNDINWDLQIERIKSMLSNYHVSSIYADATGVGDAIVERMKMEEDMPVIPVVFSGRSKAPIIQNLAVMLQQESIKIPDDAVSIDEFMRYEYNQSITGQFTYSAPAGYHDDIVCSIALLAWGISRAAKDVGGYLEPAKKNFWSDLPSSEDSGDVFDDWFESNKDFDWESYPSLL